MHIMEGFLPFAHAVGWTLASAPFVAYGLHAVKKRIRDKPEQRIPLTRVRLGSELPCLVNLQPSGKYLMEDFCYAGGLPAVMKEISGHLHLDALTVTGKSIQLTALEFGILYLLASHPNRVFSADEIFERVWQQESVVSAKTVMVHVSHLRDKIEESTGGEKVIQTVWGVGYKIESH